MQQTDQRSGTRPEFSHPVDARYHGECAPLGVRMVNAIIGFMGSWPFLIIQTTLVVI